MHFNRENTKSLSSLVDSRPTGSFIVRAPVFCPRSVRISSGAGGGGIPSARQVHSGRSRIYQFARPSHAHYVCLATFSLSLGHPTMHFDVIHSNTSTQTKRNTPGSELGNKGACQETRLVFNSNCTDWANHYPFQRALDVFYQNVAICLDPSRPLYCLNVLVLM